MLCFCGVNCRFALVDVRDEYSAPAFLMQHHGLFLDVLVDTPPFLHVKLVCDAYDDSVGFTGRLNLHQGLQGTMY